MTYLPKWGLYLTYDKLPDGRNLAVISDGSPQRGHPDVNVLTMEIVKDATEALAWFEQEKILQSWNPRS